MKNPLLLRLSRSPRKKLAQIVPKNATVVDIGCGDMTVSFDYVKRFRDDILLVGIEKFSDGTIYGPLTIPGSVLEHDSVELKSCDIEAQPMPFEDNSVDGAYCSHVLEHLAKPDHVLEQIARVLKPGGALYVEVPGPRALIAKKDSFAKRFTMTPLSMWDDPTHLRPPFTREELRALLQSHGLVVASTGYCREFGALGMPVYLAMLGVGFFPLLPKGLRSLLIGAGWWNTFGWPIYAIARKPTAAV
ncbi:MAG: methyltransferase domain-containing protein [Candidatus Baltobacteraceae bacterium]